MARKGLNIYKRKDGRWEARYIKSRNTQGKPRYGYLYATSYHEVRNNLQKVIQALNATDNEKVPATNYKFMDFSVIWLENPLTSLKESTYIRYRTLLNCYLMPSFQKLQMSEITSERVCTLCKELEKEVETFRNRALTEHYPFVTLDATYFKVRENNRVIAKALMIAYATNQFGIRDVLGFGLYKNESRETWTDFLSHLKKSEQRIETSF